MCGHGNLRPRWRHWRKMVSETSQEQALRSVDSLARVDATAEIVESVRALNKYVAEREQRIEELVQQCEKLRAERNAVRVKVEQPLLLRIRELRAALRGMLTYYGMDRQKGEVSDAVHRAAEEALGDE